MSAQVSVNPPSMGFRRVWLMRAIYSNGALRLWGRLILYSEFSIGSLFKDYVFYVLECCLRVEFDVLG